MTPVSSGFDRSIRGSTPEFYEMLRICPNPFNTQTAVLFKTAQTEEFRLSVFDVRGRLVAELFSGRVNAGEHRFSWVADHRPSGLYFIRLETEAAVMNRKLLLIK
jgi:hypothetical protein